MNIIHTCRPKTGSITVSKVVTDFAEDATYFHVTLTGSSAEPTVVSGYVQQGTPITFTELPFDTYTLVETAEQGYAATPSDPVTISRGSRNASIEVVNTMMETVKYGALYNWYAATDVRNIANTEWHVPTKTETDTLVSYLGGTATAGGKLKSTGITYFNTPNTGATNESGFNGRGGGIRPGVFSLIRQYLHIHTSTVPAFPTYNNYYLLLQYNTESALVNNTYKYYGASIRPIKDSTTLTHGQTGTYTGNDGKVYRTICIGTQEWLADNLNETKYRNGDLIPVVTDNAAWAALTTGAMCYYDNDETNA